MPQQGASDEYPQHNYVFVETLEKYKHFLIEKKSILSRAMNIFCEIHVLQMSTQTYVFMEKYEKFQYFWIEKSILSRAMLTSPLNPTQTNK